jgi:hypothetical protein
MDRRSVADWHQNTLEYRDSLSVAGWTTTAITNLHNEQIVAQPVSTNSPRFYRTMLPWP